MIDLSIEGIVKAFFLFLGIAAIFAAMFWLVSYLEGKAPSELPIYNAIRIFLAVVAVAIFICFVLALIGHPVVNFH